MPAVWLFYLTHGICGVEFQTCLEAAGTCIPKDAGYLVMLIFRSIHHPHPETCSWSRVIPSQHPTPGSGYETRRIPTSAIHSLLNQPSIIRHPRLFETDKECRL